MYFRGLHNLDYMLGYLYDNNNNNNKEFKMILNKIYDNRNFGQLDRWLPFYSLGSLHRG